MVQSKQHECPGCGGSKFKRMYPSSPSDLVSCQDCELVFFNPLPTPGELQHFYSSMGDYHSSIEITLRDYERNPELWRQSSNYILHRIAAHRTCKEGDRVLDVGAAYGFFLLSLKERGFDPYGIEISDATSRYAREHGVTMHNGTLLDTPYEKNFFDIVVMNNTLEHLLDPMEALKKTYDLLRSEGILYTAVPNFHSLVAQVDNYYWKMKSWPNHLFYFTAKTLPALYEKAGFEVVEIFSQAGESDIRDDERVIRHQLSLSDEAEVRHVIELLWKFNKGQELVVIGKKKGS